MKKLILGFSWYFMSWKVKKLKTSRYHFLPVNFPKQPFKQDFMQVLAKGIYVAQYQM